MKTLFIYLFALLFVYPWQEQQQVPQGNLLHKGMYTYTGRFFSEDGQTSNIGKCSAFHAHIFEDKLVLTEQQIGTLNYIDVTYTYVGTDSNGYRMYRKDESDMFLVDENYDLQQVLSSKSYNGYVTTNTYYEVIKGDHSREFLEQQRSRLYDYPIFMDY